MRYIMMVDDGFAMGSWLHNRIITYYAGRREAKDPGVARKFDVMHDLIILKKGVSKITLITNDQLQTKML